MAKWVAEQRLYLSEDGRIVGEEEPGRKTLLASKGREVPEDVCRKYGLGPYAVAVEPDPPGEIETEIQKPHRHSWRKDGACACGEIKVKE